MPGAYGKVNRKVKAAAPRAAAAGSFARRTAPESSRTWGPRAIQRERERATRLLSLSLLGTFVFTGSIHTLILLGINGGEKEQGDEWKHVERGDGDGDITMTEDSTTQGMEGVEDNENDEDLLMAIEDTVDAR